MAESDRIVLRREQLPLVGVTGGAAATARAVGRMTMTDYWDGEIR